MRHPSRVRYATVEASAAGKSELRTQKAARAVYTTTAGYDRYYLHVPMCVRRPRTYTRERPLRPGHTPQKDCDAHQAKATAEPDAASSRASRVPRESRDRGLDRRRPRIERHDASEEARAPHSRVAARQRCDAQRRGRAPPAPQARVVPYSSRSCRTRSSVWCGSVEGNFTARRAPTSTPRPLGPVARGTCDCRMRACLRRWPRAGVAAVRARTRGPRRGRASLRTHLDVR